MNADQVRRHSDEAVRRLREESRRRIDARRPGMSHCMLGTMLAMLLFVALNSRRIYWAHQQMDESARRPAPALGVAVEMSHVEDVEVTAFVPSHHVCGPRLERHCVVKYEPLTGQRDVTCSYASRSAWRPACAGRHNGR